MKVELAVALIAGAVALACAGGTIWSSIKNAERSDENARAVAAAKIREHEQQKSHELSNKRLAFSYAVAGQVKLFRDAMNGILADTEFNDACSNMSWVVSRYPAVPPLFGSQWQDLSLLPDRVQIIIHRAKTSWRFIQQPDDSNRPVDSTAKCIEFFQTRDRASSIMADADEIMAVLNQHEPPTVPKARP